MGIKKEYIAAALAALCLAATLFVTAPTRSQTGTEYDPWADVNDDGTIDMADISIEVEKFMSSGTPITKTGLAYDSGWIEISSKRGQYFELIHGLNTTDLVVDVQGKATVDGGPHQKNLGLCTQTGLRKSFGGLGNDVAEAVIKTADGGYAFAGHTTSYGGGDEDGWLVKTDEYGNVQWMRSYDLGVLHKDEGFYDLVQTSDGGYVLVGYSNSASDHDAIIVRTTINGTKKWDKAYTSSPDSLCFYAAKRCGTLPDDFVAVVGGQKTLGTGQKVFLVVVNSTDGFTKYSWLHDFGALAEVRTLAVLGFPLIGMAGWTQTGSDIDAFLLLVDIENTEWWLVYTYGGASADYVYDMVRDGESNDVVLAGATYSYDAGHSDFWLLRVSIAGNVYWSKTYGRSGYEDAEALVQTSDGGYALAGRTNSFSYPLDDFWLVKTDADGNEMWNRTYGTAWYDWAYDLVETSDGLGYALVGRVDPGAGNEAWLVTTDSESGLAWTNLAPCTITLYRGTSDVYWNYVRVRIWRS